MKQTLATTTTILALALAGCNASATGSVTPGASTPPAAGASTAPAAAGKLTEADVKAYVEKKEQALATGVGSAHTGVTLTWDSVQIGATRAPNEQDKIDGVRGDAVYPVRVKYTSNRTWNNGDKEAKAISYAYDFYVDQFGGWDAVLRGPVN